MRIIKVHWHVVLTFFAPHHPVPLCQLITCSCSCSTIYSTRKDVFVIKKQVMVDIPSCLEFPYWKVLHLRKVIVLEAGQLWLFTTLAKHLLQSHWPSPGAPGFCNSRPASDRLSHGSRHPHVSGHTATTTARKHTPSANARAIWGRRSLQAAITTRRGVVHSCGVAEIIHFLQCENCPYGILDAFSFLKKVNQA